MGSSHQRTEAWIANPASQPRNYKPIFLTAGASGTAHSGTGTQATVLNGRTGKLIGLTTPGRFGLLEIAADAEVQVEARLNNTLGSGPAVYTPVPVISSANVAKAATPAHLLALVRPRGA